MPKQQITIEVDVPEGYEANVVGTNILNALVLQVASEQRKKAKP